MIMCACMRMSVRAYMYVCVRACVRACVCVYVCTRVRALRFPIMFIKKSSQL